MNWLAQRAKAFAGAIAAALVVAVVKTVHDQYGVTVPQTVVDVISTYIGNLFSLAAISGAVATGAVVHQVPNSSPSQ